jgi:hypothetical protein
VAVTIYGVWAVTFMMGMCALEGRDRRFVLLFALGCVLTSQRRRRDGGPRRLALSGIAP